MFVHPATAAGKSEQFFTFRSLREHPTAHGMAVGQVPHPADWDNTDTWLKDRRNKFYGGVNSELPSSADCSPVAPDDGAVARDRSGNSGRRSAKPRRLADGRCRRTLWTKLGVFYICLASSGVLCAA